MLTRLKTRNFRNLEPAELELGAGRYLLLGPNGAGKTSILEAIYLLATTKSFRTHQIADCCRHGEQDFSLEGEVEEEGRCRLSIHFNPEGRTRLVNGSQVPLAEHLAVLPVVAWNAAEGEALSGPPRLRRTLLDRGVLGARPLALEALARYRLALEEKRALLLRGGRTVEPWNELLAREGAEIARERAAYTGKLSEAFEELLAELALPLPVIELAYLPSPSDALGGEAAILGALERAGREELRRGRPLVGPHRDDLEIRFRGTEVRRAASAGERKALSLLLSAAHGLTLERAGRLPIYLLDDLDAELSREMLASIWRPLSRGRQVLTTSNRPEVWQELEVDQRFELDEGRVRAA